MKRSQKLLIKAVDLFCGIGGLTCGLQRSGIKVAAGIDLDQSCKFAYEKNNNSVFIGEDLNNYSSDKLLKYWNGADIKVLVGCAPCQPFSRHQKDKIHRSSNEKWGLLYTYLEKVKEMKPDILSMENVPELTKELVFSDFVDGLKKLGYFVSWKKVNAADYGVPQRRSRLILLASLYGPISLIAPTSKNRHATVRETISWLPPLEAGGCSLEDSLHRCRKLSKLNMQRIEASKQGGTWHDWPKNLIPNCYKKASGQSYSAVYGRMEWDDVAPTLTTQFDVYGTGRYGHPEQNRALSLREGALLQTFPASYDFIDPKANFSERAISRQIGNAVPPRLGEIVGESILLHVKNHFSNSQKEGSK